MSMMAPKGKQKVARCPGCHKIVYWTPDDGRKRVFGDLLVLQERGFEIVVVEAEEVMHNLGECSHRQPGPSNLHL